MQQKIPYFVESEKDMKKKKTGERDRKYNDKEISQRRVEGMCYITLCSCLHA